jgi:hypothetical protein
LGPGLRNPKRGDFEVMVGVTVCDQLGYKAQFFKEVLLLGFLEDPLINTY